MSSKSLYAFISKDLFNQFNDVTGGTALPAVQLKAKGIDKYIYMYIHENK